MSCLRLVYHPRTWLLIMLAAIFMCFSMAANADNTPTEFNNPKLAARYEKLTNELRCPKCENESLASSQAPIAGDIRNRIGLWLKAGESDDQIRQQLVARFGEYVLYKPRIESRTWLLWGFPGIAVVLGVLILGLFVVRHRRNRVTELDASEREHLAELLKRHSSEDGEGSSAQSGSSH